MLLDQQTARRLYRKLLALYPRGFRKQLGESIEQTFDDLWNERQRRAGRVSFSFALQVFAETALGIIREHVAQLKEANMINRPSRQARSTAIIGAILCLPCVILFTLLTLNIEPNFGPLEPLLNNPNPDQPDVVGSLIALGTFLLVIVAFVMNLVPLVRASRAGGNIAAYPANLALAIAAFATIALIVGAIVVDQYPCWVGVPNCD